MVECSTTVNCSSNSTLTGFHPVGEVGGKLPHQNTQLPPQKEGERKRKGEREREREREREGREKWKVCMFLCYDMLDHFKIH